MLHYSHSANYTTQSTPQQTFFILYFQEQILCEMENKKKIYNNRQHTSEE